MITYEEFLKKNNIENVNSIFFGKEGMVFENVAIQDDPKQYIDVATKAKDLKYLRIGEFQNKEYFDSMTEFIKKCNEDIEIANKIVGTATKSEYLKGEEKINQVMAKVNPEWSTKQKLAYVHYQMGKLISYIPDFNFCGRYAGDTMTKNARNIWKSIVDGKSVCNGVVDVQRNILSRLGIKTKELSSGVHSFLLTETEEGNIITDPTWDLKNTLYQARPQYFGVTYEELRKREEGLSNAHKLDNPPENVIEIPEQELREIYHSIGLTRENRGFIFPILEEVEKIKGQESPDKETKIDNFFEMFSEKFSKESSHLSETRGLLETAISEFGIKRGQIRSKFVYSKEDKDSKNPYLIFHINSGRLKDEIRILDTEENKFKSIDLKEFDNRYKLHDLDTAEPFWKKYVQERENNIQDKEELRIK